MPQGMKSLRSRRTGKSEALVNHTFIFKKRQKPEPFYQKLSPWGPCLRGQMTYVAKLFVWDRAELSRAERLVHVCIHAASVREVPVCPY